MASRQMRLVLAILGIAALACSSGGGATDTGTGGDPGVTGDVAGEELPAADPGTPDAVIGDEAATPDTGTPDPGTVDPGTPDGEVAVDPGTPDPTVGDEAGAGDPATEDVSVPDEAGATDPGTDDAGPGDVDQGPDPQEGDVPQDLGPELSGPIQVTWTVRAVGADTGLPGATVALLNADGTPAGDSQTSGSDGKVTFTIDADATVGFKVSMTDYLDTYQFGYTIHNTDAPLSILSKAIEGQVATALGVTIDPAKGMVFANVKWIAKAGDSAAIGCSTVQVQPSGQVFYTDPVQQMPTTPDKAPSTSKNGGGLLIVNVPVGTATLKASIGATEIATADTPVWAGSITVNVWLQVKESATNLANPTPADCKQ